MIMRYMYYGDLLGVGAASGSVGARELLSAE
jgi:hypothetical protein